MNNKLIRQTVESCFSVVIVGSSPLLLLSALSLEKKGKQVTIISEERGWGGNWQYTEYWNHHTDTSCHLLESYKATHDILHSFKIDLVPLTGNSSPIKFIDSHSPGKFKLFPYHSRINILKEFCKKLLSLSKLFILSGVNLDKNKRGRIVLLSSDLWLFLRYRFSQVFNFEPVNIPREGWPSLLKCLTEQVVSHNIKIINDSVTTIEKANSNYALNTLGGINFHSDLVIVGQSTSLQGESIKSLGVNQSSNDSVVIKKHPHFLMEIIGLPAKLEIPCYIHLPNDSIIHRITTAFTSIDGRNCMLVQARGNDIDLDAFQNRVLEIMNKVVTRIYPDFSEVLKASILEKYEPLSFSMEKCAEVNPGFNKGILVLRTFGDLSRNITYYQGSIFEV